MLSGLILATRCANYEDVFVGGKVYFVDADCYSRMTRARMVAADPGLVVRQQNFENFPAGTTPHTTAPLDYLIVGVAALLAPFSAQALDLAGALISPLFALLAGWFLWWWSRRRALSLRWVGLLLFAVSPILAHGTALGRPDHQSLLILLVLVGLAAETTPGWGIAAGLSWGFAIWVSLYEPLVLLAAIVASWRDRKRWFALVAVLVCAAAIERRLPQLPTAALHTYFAHWSATIGELKAVSLTNPIWWQWFGGFIVLVPLLVVFVAVRRGKLPIKLLVLLGLTFCLTIWQARWGYFLGVVLCLAIPALLRLVRQRWLALALATLAFLPFLQIWDAELWPNDELQSRRLEARAEATAWRAAATAMQRATRQPFLAPWWLSPSAAYWSGQPAVAGSSHESLAGIVDTARFFLSTEPDEAREILRRHQVQWVLASDADRVAQNSAALLGVAIPPQPICATLTRAPSQAPPFLTLVGENGAGKLYRVEK